MAAKKKTAAEILTEASEALTTAKEALKESPGDKAAQDALTEAQSAFDTAESAAAVENGTKSGKAEKGVVPIVKKRKAPVKIEQPKLDAKGKPKCLKKYPKEGAAQCRVCKWHTECK